MPEGPETKYLVNWLNKDLKNKKLNNIIILGGRYKRHGNPKNLDKIIFPLTINKIKCHGKFIYWTFKNSEFVLFNTLGMSGWYNYEKEKHNNIEFKFDNFSIYFNDYRNFGTLSFCNFESLEKKLNSLGADILSEENEINKFLERVNKRKNNMIGSIIIDQKVSAGVGNYLRSEALYIAKINPFKKVSELSKSNIQDLWDILRQLGWFYFNEKKGLELKIINKKFKLYNLYKKKGPSKYKREPGYFLVYQQKFDIFGNKVITDELNKRTIHYVKEIQK